jgi:hypothetical protein
LKAGDLKADSEKTKDEANALANTILASPLEEKSNKILREALRPRLVEEISKIARDLETKAREEEEWIMNFRTVCGEEEVWIYFYPPEIGETGYATKRMKKEIGPLVAAQMRQEYPSNVWYMRYLSFVKAIEGLKQDILDGKYDERLGTDTVKLIFDALKDKAG